MYYQILFPLLAVWGSAILYAALYGAFQNPIGTPPTGVIYANVIPLAAFGLAYAASLRVRAFVRTFDPALLAGLHAMRTIGFVFLAYAGLGTLPWTFALPAGIGDILVAVTAPFIAYMTARSANFVTSSRFLGWNVFGIADFLLAVGSGSLSRILGPDVVGAGMEPMGVLPLVIIPGFLVPLLMITHVIMVIRVFQERAAAG